jgi:antitoxin component YwqK of YwqJK toxin-antitoxin module
MKKRIAISFLIMISIFACREHNSSMSHNNDVQRDTIRAGHSDTSGKDSVISNGEYYQYYKNGVIKIQGTMKNGMRQGLWKSFYENGSPWSETTFRDGKKDGKTTTWYENEQKRYEGYYSMDVESGKWIFWDEKGKLVTEKDYGKN